MDYTALTPEQQYRTVQHRLLEMEQQHLLATINAAAARAAGEDSQAEVLERQTRQWEASARAVRDLLAGLPEPAPTERAERPRPRERSTASRVHTKTTQPSGGSDAR